MERLGLSKRENNEVFKHETVQKAIQIEEETHCSWKGRKGKKIVLNLKEI
jgi:hypothetical protein